MSTTIATWGNSDAVRIPRDVMVGSGLKTGDRVDVTIADRGVVVIRLAGTPHRHVAPAEGVSFESLFSGYAGERATSTDPLPEDDLVGAERDAWA